VVWIILATKTPKRITLCLAIHRDAGDVASDRSNSRCGWFLYSAFAETFRAFRGIDFVARLHWLFDRLKTPCHCRRGKQPRSKLHAVFSSRPIIETKQNLKHLREDSG
jgi:hypothetical protein